MDKMKQIEELEVELKRLKEEALVEKQVDVDVTKDFSHNKITVLEFIKYIEKHHKDFGFKYGYDLGEMLERKDPYLLGKWILTVVHVHGGYEGAGDEYYGVVKLSNFGGLGSVLSSHWLIPGWYSSYNGSELELHDTYQVEPFEKVVIDYRKVGS